MHGAGGPLAREPCFKGACFALGSELRTESNKLLHQDDPRVRASPALEADDALRLIVSRGVLLAVEVIFFVDERLADESYSMRFVNLRKAPLLP